MKTVQDVFTAILSTSDTLGCEVSVVGGYVRDLLLGRPFKKDIDCVVVGSGLVFARAFDTQVEKIGRLIEFPDFDTARYLIPLGDIPVGEPGAEVLELEFAGARSETYDPTSRKPVVSSATLETDMRRRDFTVNAMAIPVSVLAKKNLPSLTVIKKAVFDPLGGQKDLAEKVLKTPLDPDATFSDDPLRMLRAIRFASQLDFTIDGSTLEAIHRNRKRLSIISAERIQEELFKLLATKTPSIGLFLLFQTHLLDVFLPEVSSLDGVE